jgi:hypothetical protein
MNKVADLEKQIQTSSQILSDFKATMNNDLRSEMSVFAENEDLVFGKLNELVTASNSFSNTIKEAVQGVQETFLEQALSTIKAESHKSNEEIKKDFQQVERKVDQLVDRPTMDQATVISSISDQTTLKLKNLVLKEISQQVTDSVMLQLQENFLPKVADQIIKKIPDGLTKEVKILSKEVSAIKQEVSQLQDGKFTSTHAQQLEYIWSQFQPAIISKGKSSRCYCHVCC